MTAHFHPSSDGLTSKKDMAQGRLIGVLLLNLFITLAELAGGMLANSLALVSDAVHNFGDTLSIFVAWLAGRISDRDPDERKTYGYRRAEILSALLNASVLIVICLFLLSEGWKRLMNPESVKGGLMVWIAVIGLAANFLSILLLKKEKGKSLNIRAAYLHLLGDTLSSVAVVAGGILILFFRIYWIDPVLTLFISLYILKETYEVLRQTVDILMQGTPRDLDLNRVQQVLEQIEGIDNIHHVHAWNLSDREVHFECHVDLAEDIRVSESEKILNEVTEILREQFGISHVTLQFEYNCCEDKELLHSRREGK
ncbi:MAG: cation diffusion facilitator family transporter [Bacteroidales bacterium]